MSDRFHSDPPDFHTDVSRPPEAARQDAPLPPWVKSRILRPDEEVTSVRGPRFNPSWEKYVTHIGLFLAALAFAVAVVAIGYLVVGSWDEPVVLLPVLVAAGTVFLSICVLAAFNGFFTRLVVTNQRVLIVQGYEVRKTWKVDDLPPFLVRQQRGRHGETSRTVDMDALTSMLGSDGFTDAKSIWAMGKELDRIRKSEGRGR
jgi:hypothetical protein